MVWGKIYSNTVSADDQSFDTGTVSTSKLIDIIFSQNGHTGNCLMRFNGDTGSNYAERFDVNGGGDSVRQSGTSNINVLTAGTGDVQTLTFLNMVNISGEEKLSVYDTVYTNATGAGTAPLRVRGVSKWANTSAQITQTTVTDSGNGFDTGSNLSVLGSDITPAAAIPFVANAQEGSRAEITDTRKIYYKFDANAYHSEVWFELGTAPYAGGRGVFGGGYASTYQNAMDYITIATPSNATDFGDLTVARTYVEAVSSITRGIFGGGHTGANSDVMDYITFATPSNATDFGNLTVARHAVAGVSSGTRGVFGGGNGSNVMEYITIATPSNATDFGDLTVTRQDLAGVSSDTRGVFAGGDTSNVMDYITISTAGNATDFGDLLSNLRYPADVSNGTRGVFAGGDPNSGSGNTNVIQYITIATTGNATDFGDLTVGRHAPAGVESDTRGVIGGGATASGGSNYSNVMDYITIATTGNATDFGDLSAATNHLGGASRF